MPGLALSRVIVGAPGRVKLAQQPLAASQPMDNLLANLMPYRPQLNLEPTTAAGETAPAPCPRLAPGSLPNGLAGPSGVTSAMPVHLGHAVLRGVLLPSRAKGFAVGESSKPEPLVESIVNEGGLQMSSVLKKRKMKMKKHKHRKLLKKTRMLRRRLGKA